jgi:hypothetical protein
MTQSDWNTFDTNFKKSANVDSPSVYSPSGERIPSGAETQATRVSNIRENARAISNWRQQEEIRKGQGAQVGGPVNMFGRPVKDFFVKTDPATGRTPIPELKPMPSFGGNPDFAPKFPAFLGGAAITKAPSYSGGAAGSMAFNNFPSYSGEKTGSMAFNNFPSYSGGAAGSISSGFLPPFSSAFNNLSTGGSYLSPAIEEREKQARSLGLGFEMSPFQQYLAGFNRQPTRAETSILGLRKGIQNLPVLSGLMGSPASLLAQRTMAA